MSIKTETQTEYVEETGETFYGIYADVSNKRNRNLFDKVMNDLGDAYKKIIRNDRWRFKFVLIDMRVYINQKYMIINTKTMMQKKILGNIKTHSNLMGYRYFKMPILNIFIYLKNWDKTGNPTLKGLELTYHTEGTQYYNYSGYTTKCDLETFMINSGYIQNKLIQNKETITLKRVNQIKKEICKMKYRDIALWIYKQY